MSTGSNSGGPNKGRNIGLNMASGDYICIADHDDEWKKNKLITQLPYLKKAPIVTSGYTIIDQNRTRPNRLNRLSRLNRSSEDYIYFKTNQSFLDRLSKSLTGQNVYLGSLIYRKELKHILFEEHFGMVDFDWLLRMLHNQDSIEVCQALYFRYVEKTNLSLNESYRRKDFYFSLMTIEQYASEYPKQVSLSYKKIHGSRARYYYLIDNMKKARFYFLRSELNLKTLAYYLSTFFGSAYVKKKFNVFG